MKLWDFGRKEKAAVVVAGAAILSAVLGNLDFNLLEATLYDWRMAHGPQKAPLSDIVLVALDNDTIRERNEAPPLALDAHAQLIEKLGKLEPRAVGYLTDMGRVAESDPNQLSDGTADRFVDAVRRMESQGIPFVLGTRFDVTGEILPPYPLSSLDHSVAIIHKDGNVFAEDKVTRRALTYLYDQPVFHLDMARRIGHSARSLKPRGNFVVPETSAEYFFFRYHGDPREPVYRTISFSKILSGEIAADEIRGKIVLVGTVIKEDSNDFSFTPYSKTPFANPKLAVHAHILNSVLANDGLVRVPAWINWVTSFLAIALVMSWVLVMSPLRGVFATLGLTAVFCATALLLFSAGGIWIRASQPLVGIFLSYYLVVPYRLIREYKKRWDYQRENELLTQVEELKTNFLSLVTHDLKTPVARIQGLAEVLLLKASARMIDRDRETVQSIMGATDELNRFISSILELNKVESNRLQIFFESKDINLLIEKAAEGFKAQCRAKKIKLQLTLEPLFPIKLDPSLISKVINNLIDNAIKYSPTGSEIHLSSKEVRTARGDQVEISIRDAGIGMTETELNSLFTRFYRAKNDATTATQGTGLGLYLSKYFVEAHQGDLRVESVPGQGSTFSIILPVDPAQSPSRGKGATTQGLTRTAFFSVFKKEKSDVQSTRSG